MRLGKRSVWRSRALLFAILGLALLANIAFLVTHSVFYEARLAGLQAERGQLEKQRDEARAAAEKVVASDRRLKELREELDRFYSETLGARRERLAPLIEKIYLITQKAGLVPDGFAFHEEEVPGARRLALSFRVEGTYAEVKKLLAAFENDPGFLVLETVTVSLQPDAPDLLGVGLVVGHYFRSEEPAHPARARAARRPR